MTKGSEIYNAVRTLTNVICRQIDHRFRKAGVEKLTGSQYAIMEYIHEFSPQGDIYQKDIESAFKIRRSTTSVILKAMEENGFIERVSVEKDARLKKILPTQYAINGKHDAQNLVQSAMKDLTSGISDEELNTFLHITAKLIKNMETYAEIQNREDGRSDE